MTTITIKHREDSAAALVVTTDDGATLIVGPGETVDTTIRAGSIVSVQELEAQPCQ